MTDEGRRFLGGLLAALLSCDDGECGKEECPKCRQVADEFDKQVQRLDESLKAAIRKRLLQPRRSEVTLFMQTCIAHFPLATYYMTGCEGQSVGLSITTHEQPDQGNTYWSVHPTEQAAFKVYRNMSAALRRRNMVQVYQGERNFG